MGVQSLQNKKNHDANCLQPQLLQLTQEIFASPNFNAEEEGRQIVQLEQNSQPCSWCCLLARHNNPNSSSSLHSEDGNLETVLRPGVDPETQTPVL